MLSQFFMKWFLKKNVLFQIFKAIRMNAKVQQFFSHKEKDHTR